MENEFGLLERVPFHYDGARFTLGGISYRMGKAFEHPRQVRLVYKGSSGAPCYLNDGTFLGGFSRNTPFPESHLFGILPPDGLEAGLALGKASLSGRDLSLQAIPFPQLEPGESVAVARVWGPGLSSHASGVVTIVEEGEAFVFCHGYSHEGPTLWALLRAPVDAFVRMGRTGITGLQSKLSTPGEVVGTVMYDGHLGLYALIGAAPPTLRLEVRTLSPSSLPKPRVYHVVKSETMSNDVARAIDHAISSSWLKFPVVARVAQAMASDPIICFEAEGPPGQRIVYAVPRLEDLDTLYIEVDEE